MTQYEEEGYCVIRGLVPASSIDALLDVYRETVLPSKQPFFRQNTNRWTRTNINSYGHATDSFRDVHDYPRHPRFCAAVKDILCAPAMQDALREVSGSAKHHLVQSMMFDQNTNTSAHQDWYFLDSMPNGHLFAGWFALEDIHEDAGRFYVFPRSHKLPLDPSGTMDLNELMEKVTRWYEANLDQMHAPALAKGDALFWNSRVIHGSLPTRDERRSRMSLTAHYLPSQYQFGARNAKYPVRMDFDEWQGMKLRRVLGIHKNYSLPARITTDAFAYLYSRPALRKLALSVASLVKR